MNKTTQTKNKNPVNKTTTISPARSGDEVSLSAGERKVYILNTLIVPIDFDKYPSATVKLTKISVEEAKELLSKNQFTSAIGHEATAKILSQLLGVNIPVNRVSVWMEPGDVGLHFFLKTRLPEGKVLSEEELKQLQFWLVKSEVLDDDDDEEEKKFIESIKEIFGDC